MAAPARLLRTAPKLPTTDIALAACVKNPAPFHEIQSKFGAPSADVMAQAAATCRRCPAEVRTVCPVRISPRTPKPKQPKGTPDADAA
ncbi:hypothetical protein [Streptomyces sp. cg36]|uniref:hypothetical protein n=1 Tax=Streptomyces sp. cg36 TaxID=3238798 RepID=UPI0034E24340